MSASGLTSEYNPPTLDGLTVIEADQVIIDGKNVDIDALVPYTGATRTLNMGSNSIKTTYTPIAQEDVVNLQTLQSAVLYIDNTVALSFLNKVTTTPQTVVGNVTFNGTVTGNYFYTDNSYNWGRLNASYNAWSINRVLNGSIIRDLQFKDETDSVATLLLSSSGQTVYVGLTCDYGTASKVPVWDANKKLVSSGTDSIKISYLDNVGSDIQTQLNARALTTYVDTQDALRLLLTGGTMSGLLQMNGNKVQSSAVPTTGNDLTNKTYVDGVVSGAGYVLRAGDTATGTIYNSGGDFWPYKGNDTNKGVKLFANNADGATYTTYNGGLGSWNGIGFFCSNDNTTRFIFDTRTGNSSQVGSLSAGGATLTGTLSMGANKVTSSYTPVNAEDLTRKGYVDGANSAQDIVISTKASTSYVDTADALRVLKTGDTMTGTLLVNAYIGVNQSNPQWKIHASNTNAWATQSTAKADGIMAIGGGDNNPHYQYIVYPNPAQADGGVSDLVWWSSDMLTGRYKNEFRLAWWKETHGFLLGNAYKEGITLFLTDSLGYTNIDYIKLNGNTTVNGKLTTTGVDTTAQINIGLASNTTPNIKFANSLNHITGNAAEAYLFNGVNGYIAIGRNTTRSDTEANLHIGTTGLDASIESIASDGSGYLPLSYYGSKHYFTGGNVGIGTGSTDANLHVWGKTKVHNGTVGIPAVGTNGGNGTRLILWPGDANEPPYGLGISGGTIWYGCPSAAIHAWYVGTSEKMRLTSAGYVGIGTASPAALLDIYSTTADYTNSFQVRTPWASISLDGTQIASGRAWTLLHGGVGSGVGVGNFGIFDETANAYRFTINSSGNVGIGRNPGERFDVEGVIRAYGNGAGGPSPIYSQNDSAGDAYAVMFLRNNSGNGCYWFLNSTTRSGDGGANCATIRNDTGTLRLQSNNSSSGISIQATSGAVNVRGGSPYAVPNGYMSAGSLTIGSADANYGWSNNWSTNTAGLMMECYDLTDIVIHDAGERLASFMSYAGGAGRNLFILGRDMGYGTSFVYTAARFSVATDSQYGHFNLYNPDGSNTHFGTSERVNYMRGGMTLFDTSTNSTWYLQHYLQNDGLQQHNAVGTWGVAIWAGATVVTQSWFGTVSDRRIKTNIKPVGDMLNIINKIEVVSFDFIDSVIHKRDECGVIAQQVEEVFPNAVDKTTGVIANIVQRATRYDIQDGKMTIEYKRSDGDELVVGCKVKLIVGSHEREADKHTNGDYIVPVLAVRADSIVVEWKEEFSMDGLSVVVYGKEVDDFRNVDKEQLGVMAIKGIQELDKKLQVLEQRETVWVQHAKEQEEKIKRLEANLEKVAGLLSQLISK